MPRSASPKRVVYNYKKIMLTMIMVFWGQCFWLAQTLVCHKCEGGEDCTYQQTCREEETVCVSETVKMPNSTQVHKLCFTSCEDFLSEESTDIEDKNTTEGSVKPNISEVSHTTKNTKTLVFKQDGFLENDILCCENDLCNQASPRDPEDTALVFGFLLSFMWFIQCSVL